jgi:class 3 adenylate cyclase
MGADEEGTLARLKRIREEVTDRRWRSSAAGSSRPPATASSPSSERGRRGAVRGQGADRDGERGAAEPAATRIVFRIGINLGDVIVEGDDLYGDGVNVAARLEGISEQGGVAISGSAHEQVRGKVPFAFSIAASSG